MTYRLELHEPMATGLRRILLEECARGDAALQPGENFSVHRVRMSLKRARALLRLAAHGMPRRAARAIGADLRRAARSLAPVRERTVLAETLTSLEARGDDKVAVGIACLRREASTDAAESGAVAVRRAQRRIRGVERRLAAQDFAGVTPEIVCRGLAQAQRRTIRAARRASRHPGDETFHALRRRVQDHWRQMLVLSRAWPGFFEARARVARSVSRLLGEDHDLAAIVAVAGDAPETAALVRQCRAEQAMLRRRAAPLIGLLVADRPGGLARRVRAYWAAAAAAQASDDMPPAQQALSQHDGVAMDDA